MLFSAIAIMAFAGSSFASNEIVVEDLCIHEESKNEPVDVLVSASCTIEVWKRNANGEMVLFSTHQVKMYPYKSCADLVEAANKKLVLSPN